MAQRGGRTMSKYLIGLLMGVALGVLIGLVIALIIEIGITDAEIIYPSAYFLTA